MNTLVLIPLRIVLGLLLLGSLGVQAVIAPLLFRQASDSFPGFSSTFLGYTIALIAFVLCFQIALVAAWRLLTVVGHGIPDSPRPAVRWVDVILAAAAAATLLCGAVAAHMHFVTGTPLLLAVSGAAVGCLGGFLIVLVMRRLLILASADHRELQAVI